MKKKVRLDIFQESVLPQLQSKHADLAALQKAIDDGYEIVDVAEDGKETVIAFVVTKGAAPAPATKDAAADAAAATAVDPATVKALVDAAVKAALETAAAKTKAKRPQLVVVDAAEKFTIPAEVKRVGQLKNFKGERGGFKADERAFRFGMWALASISKQMPGRFSFVQATDFVDTHIKAVHAEGTNTLGGYLVPEEFGTDLIDLREQYGVFRRNAKIRTMTSDTRTDPRRTSGLSAYFVAEKGAGTESNKGWDQVRLTAKDLMVLSRYTAQLSADAVINIGDDLAGEIGYAFALKEDQCGFLGDGTSTYGGIVGVLPALVNMNGVDEGGGMIVAAGDLQSEFLLADYNRVVGAIPQYAAGPGAKWYTSRSHYYGTMQRLELASGGVTSMEVREGNTTPKFLGFPVEISQVFPTADAVSQIAAVFGNLPMAATFGDRQQDAIAFSEHATIGGENVFERNEIAIRGTERFDINVHDIGSATAAGPVVGLMSKAS